MTRLANTFLTLAVAACLVASPARAADKDEAEKPARFEISGLGLFKNRELSRMMDDFVNPGEVAALSDDAAENAAFVLVSELEEDGYLHPKIEGHLTFLDGTTKSFEFDETLAIAFPRKAGTHIVRFDVERGVRYYIAEVHFEGLHAVEADAARNFFQPAYGLWSSKRSNVFSEASVRRGKNTLIATLASLGFAGAEVTVRSSAMEKPDGAMRLDVTVRQGPRWFVTSLARNDLANTGVDTAALDKFIDQPWWDGWRQDVNVTTRRFYYRAGYPDVSTRIIHEARPVEGSDTEVAATVEIQPGPLVRIGEIRFEGNDRTRLGVIKRRVRLETGDPLNPTAVENARLRLGRLAAFDSVSVATPSGPQDDVRDVVFSFEEAAPWTANVLFGYGSYEEFRIGAEVRRSNLFGRAHQDRFSAIQSMKSTRGDYTYTVPDLFGEAIDGSVRAFVLRRDEFSFRREEYGGSVVLRKKFGRRGPEVSAGYTYETLRDKENTLATSSVDNEDVKAASVNLGIAFDRRDQALSPRAGYRLHMQAEAASESLGGEVDYQRVEWGAAYHRALAPDRWLHAGLSQGVVFTFGGDPAVPPPVNKLYYPGGDSSLRGYREGEASPRTADGSFLGAKTYTVINLELEQALTSQWSLVLFYDWLIESARLRDYPGDVTLGSIGLGLRYNTIVGPLRVEYGRNLNPRTGDPSGTWHFSVGYPF